jgi:hypothetical protein
MVAYLRLETLKSQAVCHWEANFHSLDPPCFCAKVRSQFCKAREHSTAVLELVDEALTQVSLLVQVPVVLPLL